MKNLYWRPTVFSGRMLLISGIVSLALLYAVENFRIRTKQPYLKEKTAAARLAKKAMDTVARETRTRGIVVDPEVDPSGSGLIGELISPVTSNSGSLSSKQTSINPNFAAVIVHLLKKAGVSEGDSVAVGVSGSFPAINIAVLSAIETLKLKPVIISSVASSQWGANRPDFLWIDMENLFIKEGIFSHRTTAATLGGIDDRALGISKKGKRLLSEGIARNGLQLLQIESFQQSIDERMRIYNTSEVPVRVYINTGGGAPSVGRKTGKKMFEPGLNKTPPAMIARVDSVMTRYILEGVPVIHLSKIEFLAQRYGLPLHPAKVPEPGEGIIFYKEEYNRVLAAIFLAVITGMLFVFYNTDIGQKLLKGRSRASGRIEPMV